MSFYDLTKAWVQRHGADEAAFSRLEQYVALINAAQAETNLTGFTGDELWEKGIYYSLVALNEPQLFISESTAADIGPGAGFPSVPYLIVFPHFKLTLVEPRKKRAAFLSTVITALGLNAEVVVTKAKDVTKHFDVVTAQAVGSVTELVEWTRHMLAPRGVGIFLKGPRVYDELEAARGLIRDSKLRAKIIKVTDQSLQNQVFLVHISRK